MVAWRDPYTAATSALNVAVWMGSCAAAVTAAPSGIYVKKFLELTLAASKAAWTAVA